MFTDRNQLRNRENDAKTSRIARLIKYRAKNPEKFDVLPEFSSPIARNFCIPSLLKVSMRPCAGHARRLSLARRAGLMQNIMAAPGCAAGRHALLDVSRAAGIGLNLRQLRIAKGLTMDRLAGLSDLTRGYISLVERGLKMPSIAALLRLADALGVNVAYLFDPNSAPPPRYTLFRQRDQRSATTMEGTFGLSALAAGRPGKMMEPFLLQPPLKAASRASYHAGEEMLFVVSGRISIKLDGEYIEMEKGDCLYFAGETPHEVRSLGRQKAEVLVVVASAQPER
jgi:transcriptional regulator with XRE-family HTH domain